MFSIVIMKKLSFRMRLREVRRKSTNTLQGPAASFFRIQHTVTSRRHQSSTRFLLQIL